MRRWLWSSVGCAGLLAAALGGCLGGDPCVDQTGYLEGCGDPALDDSERPAAGLERAAEGVWFAAHGPLGGVPVDVTVVAVKGTFSSAAAVQLVVPGRGARRAVDLVDGGFVEEVEATVADTVRVLVDGQLALTLVLDEAGPPGLGHEDDASAPNGPASLPPVTDGAVDVGDGRIEGLAAPYLAWTPALGSAVHVEPGEGHARLPARVGDALCVARVADGTPRAGAPVCLTLE